MSGLRLGSGAGVRPVSPLGRPEVRPVAGAAAAPAREGLDFASVLRAEVGGIRFSQHAQQRLQSRGVSLGERETARLKGAIGTLAQKGGRTSLVMLDSLAFVVSVPNRTVITAVQAPEEAVFTNIDSAIRA